MIRQAVASDIDRILELGVEFGHLMKFHQQKETLLPHIDNIIVNKRSEYDTIDGYYHIQPLESVEDLEFVEKEKTFPTILTDSLLLTLEGSNRLGILMQGASHRETFRAFIQYYQERYTDLWCWCSIKSRRPESYKDLGFSFNPKVEYTFFNLNVDRESTYQLGTWTSRDL